MLQEGVKKMYDIACLVEEGIGCHGNDDRALLGNQILRGGRLQEYREDHIWVAICDGVGGEAFGHEAAEIAINRLSEIFEKTVTVDFIHETLSDINQRVVEAQRKDYGHSKMATTVAGLYVHGDSFIVYNLGDTRVYRYRPPYIARLSSDHTLVEEMKALGLTPKAGQEHVITKFLGSHGCFPELVDGTEKVMDVDSFLLCSDGISDFISDLELEGYMNRCDDSLELCSILVEESIARGSEDNLSIIIVRKV